MIHQLLEVGLLPKLFRLGIAVISHQVEFPEDEFDIRRWKKYRERCGRGGSIPKKKDLPRRIKTKRRMGSRLALANSFGLSSQIY